MTTDEDTYALRAAEVPEMAAPDLAYRPPAPRDWCSRIGLIGAGGISGSHLDAYRTAGWEVAGIWNRTRERAEARAAAFCPGARIAESAADIFSDPAIDVVDITPHPEVRAPLIDAALRAGKHVLSQKPFVTDMAEGERLADLAEAQGLHLAINQNGRWAPHLSWMREAHAAGLIGTLQSCHVSIHWDHNWVAGTPFDEIEPLVLYDFAVHWFDFLVSLAGQRVRSVYAGVTRAEGQKAQVPLMAQALVRLDGGQASFVFDGATPHGPRDTTYMAGTEGSLQSDGPDLGTQAVTLTTGAGRARPALEGTWFNDGFRGAMGELLVAIEEGRAPLNGARENLQSLALCFAAIASARRGCEVAVGEVRSLNEAMG